MRARDIEQRLAEHFAEDGPWRVTAINRNATPVGVDVVYRAAARGRSLAVKCNHRREKNRREFEALMRMHRLGVDCARPVWIAQDDAFYVMDWLSGADLRRQMHSPRRLALIGAAGRWLHDYHRRTARRLPV